MSYINEALKKVQQEKDMRGIRYEAILARSAREKTASRGKSARKGCLIVLLILLAFAGFSWLDSRWEETPQYQQDPRIRATLSPSRPREGVLTVDASSLYEKARQYYREGKIREAKRLYKDLLQQDPGHVEALNNLGVIHMQTGDLTSAQEVFEKAIRLKPGFVDPFYNMACLFAAKGETESSLSYLKRAISLSPAVRGWARKDLDLANLRGLEAFEKIVMITQPDQG
ncbi:MAG: tetratricopeptide repeat protein [Deltaproteobacteria bacterium]|nr:tetratricopeptide repeat protein [Deltaproteobacteria bacterium]